MYAPEDLINKIKNQPELFIKKVYDLVGKEMKFNAVVGNPPYQEVVAQKETDNGQKRSSSIFQYFQIPVQDGFIGLVKDLISSD